VISHNIIQMAIEGLSLKVFWQKKGFAEVKFKQVLVLHTEESAERHQTKAHKGLQVWQNSHGGGYTMAK